MWRQMLAYPFFYILLQRKKYVLIAMQRILTILVLLCLGFIALADDVNRGASPSVAMTIYVPDEQGIYQKKTNVPVKSMEKSASCYAYDKKGKCLYFFTEFGNFAVKINDETSKVVKKDEKIPQLSGEELRSQIMHIDQLLEEKFTRLNANRRRVIADSIAAVKERQRLEAIERARQDSIRRANEIVRLNRYRAEHKWRWVPVNVSRLDCSLCEESISVADSVFALTVSRDTIYFPTIENGLLGNKLTQIHICPVPSQLRDSESFNYHLEAFDDSIAATYHIQRQDVVRANIGYLDEVLAAVDKQAPYGYFVDWDWADDYSMVTFEFAYFNTNKETIKYIDVYWKITNDVGDVRLTGHFKGTGPVRKNTTGHWNWDHSSYIVAGDATTMDLTKVIITYMNGKQQTLTKKMIICESDFDEE